MPFDIEFTKAARDHVRGYKKFEQQIILDACIQAFPQDSPAAELIG